MSVLASLSLKARHPMHTPDSLRHPRNSDAAERTVECQSINHCKAKLHQTALQHNNTSTTPPHLDLNIPSTGKLFTRPHSCHSRQRTCPHRYKPLQTQNPTYFQDLSDRVKAEAPKNCVGINLQVHIPSWMCGKFG